MQVHSSQLLVVAFLLACFGSTISLEPTSDSGSTCRNTVQGRTHILDDKGWLCEFASLDWVTGCCQEGKASEERYSCRTCEDETKCCEVSLSPRCATILVGWPEVGGGIRHAFVDARVHTVQACRNQRVLMQRAFVQVYENCVGCCMRPEHEQERQMAMSAVKKKKTFEKAVAAKDAFEFCR
jgi:hypothetical protein